MAGLTSDWGEDASKIRVMNCSSCGAQLILDETIAASLCSYCGNNTIVLGKFSGILKLDNVIPLTVMVFHERVVNFNP